MFFTLTDFFFTDCKQCNHSILNPCCDRNNICTLKSPSNSYTCRKKGIHYKNLYIQILF